MISSFRRFHSLSFRPMTRSASYMSPILSRNLLIQSHSKCPSHLNTFSLQPVFRCNTTTSKIPFSVPGTTEDGFIPIYHSTFPKKHWLIRAYAVAVSLFFMKAGYHFYDTFSKDSNTDSPFKPILGLIGPCFMAATGLRVGLMYAKKLLLSVHYNPLTQQVKLTFPNRKTQILNKNEVYTSSRVFVETLLERKSNIFSLRPTKFRLKKNLNLHAGDEVYVLEKNGDFKNERLLDFYLYSPQKPNK
ncbi:hypothetical protein HMI54_015224 [Coelomomyces lativittatus]|nr:hypothetical protein HMI56_000181 [Coelomomyces lativittatus]KAJ1513117.1 hypothetical protein HMI54_015224 [Coelomomyces lativittatus]KAJ1515344.1 hypothetical protein HMI55_003794 [Coelomomyces lativittatus]